MSKLIRISDDAYDFIKSLDGKITDNVDQVIRSFKSIKNKPIASKRNRDFNEARILSLALLIEIIQSSKDDMDYYRKDFLENCFEQLKEWKKDFPKFFDQENKTIFTRSLDYYLLRYIDKEILMREEAPKKILHFWIQDDSNNSEYLFAELLQKLFKSSFRLTNLEMQRVINVNNKSTRLDSMFSWKDETIFVEIKKGKDKPSTQLLGESIRNSQNYNDFKEVKDELLNSSKELQIIDEKRNLFAYKKFKFQITYGVIEPAYLINPRIEILMENPTEILEEILSYSNTKTMDYKKYFPIIFNYFYQNKKESKIVLLINHIKLEYLENKAESKKISSDQKKIINNEINALLESKNFKEEQDIRKSDKWYVA